MTHWKLTLSYDGTGFHGWQVQPGFATVQGALAAALHRITGETTLPQGSGRTDAGVHALAQVASVSLAADLPAPNLRRALNSILPASIRVLTAEPVSLNFHARHSAVRKTYRYRIFERRLADPSTGEVSERICPPFIAPYAWDCRWPLDLDRMNEAAALLCGEHDFASFAASDPDRTTRTKYPWGLAGLEQNPGSSPSGMLHRGPATSSARTVYTSRFTRTPDLLSYDITGSGFLHHMVRNIVGTLVDAGRGALALPAFAAILAARDRTEAGPTAPAQGLFLVAVEYPAETP